MTIRFKLFKQNIVIQFSVSVNGYDIDVERFLKEGRKISAIKAYRDWHTEHNLEVPSLADSKKYIEQVQDRLEREYRKRNNLGEYSNGK